MCSGIRYDVLNAMRGAEDLGSLRRLREMEQNRLSAEISSTLVDELTASLGEMHDTLTSRALQLAETELARLGFGAPPVPYAYLLFGSGGRSEQTMSSDQDSGIVYASPATNVQADTCRNYFGCLAVTAVRFFMEIGYPPCEGNVVAANPEWCLSVQEWEEKIEGWFADPSWEHVRYLLIFADGRPAAGESGLLEALKNRFFGDLLQSPVIARRMMENTLRHKVLIGVFGQLLRETYGENAGGVDIKYGAYIPMVNVIRLMAAQSGIRETNTLRRLAALHQAGTLTTSETAEAADAFQVIMKLRLLTAVKKEGTQWIGTGKLPKEQLTKELAALLKKALRTGKKLQRRVEREWQHRLDGR